MKYIYIFLPFVGLFIGFISFLWYNFCIRFNVNSLSFSIGVSLIPLFITGGIHLDGFCDSIDAICSYKDREKALEIMKDSHIGAFAVIYLIAYFLINIALYNQIFNNYNMVLFSFSSFVFSRIFAGVLQFLVPNAKKEGLSFTFNKSLNKITIFVLVFYLFLLALFIRIDLYMIGLVLLILFTFFFARYINKKFGGITGDLSGFYIVMAEIVVLLTAFIGGIL